jgi:hypothetical protein
MLLLLLLLMSRVAGRYLSVEDGSVLGEVAALSAVTHGQGARIGGLRERWFVAGKVSGALQGAAADCPCL